MDENAQGQRLEAAVRELIPPLTRYLHHYVSDPVLAEDLLQETLARISRGLEGFENRSSLTTWAFAIATRVAADHFRRPEHRLKIVDVLDLEDIEELALEESLVDQKLDSHKMNACIREVIDSLPEDYRAALVLYDLEELTARQVAEICDIPLSTAKIRIHRARKRLREAFKTECEFYRDDDNVFRCYRKPDPSV